MRYLLALGVLLISIGYISAQSESASNCPSNFTGYLPPRLTSDEQARVVFDVELNLRPLPSLNEARIATLSGGTHFLVQDGPVCEDDFVWWQIEVDDAQGWIAEGSLEDDEYFVEPRGELVLIENDNGNTERYIETVSGFLEPEGCLAPPDDYKYS